uniref:Uncharacterized protein n=1 Tax=Glossina austeni TaxID=7395 RepID=A0A1A9UMZ3_GLOAU
MFAEEIAKIEDFQYVVNPPTIQKIAFGSTLPRLVLPLSGPCLSSFMRAHQGDGPLSPGPAAHVAKTTYKNLYFNILGFRPSAYACDKPTLKLKISSAFGSEHKYIPHVEIKCFPYNIVVCAECGQTPIGDYWHNANNNQDICRTCMTTKKTILRSCHIDNAKRRSLRRKLEEYRYRRYCSFFHNHNGTTAAEQIMPTKTLIYKINLENYLSQRCQCFNVACQDFHMNSVVRLWLSAPKKRYNPNRIMDIEQILLFGGKKTVQVHSVHPSGLHVANTVTAAY